jgi:hypothetical protein
MVKAHRTLSSIGSSLFIIIRKKNKSEQEKLEKVTQLIEKKSKTKC